MIGFHLQGSVDDWPQAAAQLPDYAPIKFTDGGPQRAVEAKGINRTLYTVVRYVVQDQNPQELMMVGWHDGQPTKKFGGELGSQDEKDWYSARTAAFFGTGLRSGMALTESTLDFHQHARDFFAMFIDETFRQHAHAVNAVGEYNEYFANSQGDAERNKWIRWAQACVDVWRDDYRTQKEYAHIELILAETSIGNDIPPELAKMSHDNHWVLLGYHPYVPVWRGDIRPDDWVYYSGRWEQMDIRYRRLGYTVRWFFGEFGAVGHNGPGWPNSLAPNDGWEHKEVYNGDLAAYIGMMTYWMDRARETVAWRDGRVQGAVIFTSGGGTRWRWFELRQPEMGIVAASIKLCMDTHPPIQPPVKPPEPPTPPTFKGLVNGSFEDGWTDKSTTAQEPHGWVLHIYSDGDVRGRPINGTPECVHKLAEQLPPDEQPGGENALILDGETCYKMFTQATWRATLWQVVSGLAPGARVVVMVPVNIHFDGRDDTYDAEDTLLRVNINGDYTTLVMTKERSRQWQYIQINAVADADGEVDIEIEPSVKWEHPTAFFFDAITLEVIDEPEEPVMKDWQTELWDASLELQTIELNPKAAIQAAIFADGYVPVEGEFWMTASNDISYAAQAAEHLGTGARRVYYAEVPNWADVQWFTEPEPVGITIDVSHWQGRMDWAKAKAAGVTHAFIKATQGISFKDPEFDNNWAGAKAQGIKRGAFHYYENRYSPDSQAAWFLEVIGDDVGELPLINDVEDENGTSNSNAILEWLTLVEDDAEHEVAIYTRATYWDEHFPEHLDWPKEYKLWVAHWTDAYEPDIPEDWDDWWLWQYMNNADGYLYGASSPHIDLDSFNEVF